MRPASAAARSRRCAWLVLLPAVSCAQPPAPAALPAARGREGQRESRSHPLTSVRAGPDVLIKGTKALLVLAPNSRSVGS